MLLVFPFTSGSNILCAWCYSHTTTYFIIKQILPLNQKNWTLKWKLKIKFFK